MFFYQIITGEDSEKSFNDFKSLYYRSQLFSV
jgi:hypothetical protein